MACLVPYFKCPTFILHPHQVKARSPINFHAQCVSSQMTAVLELDKAYVPTLESHKASCAVMRSLSYVGTIGPPVKTDYEATWRTETLLTYEKATVAAASAQAIALARAAVEVAKDAAQMIENDPSIKSDKTEEFPSHLKMLDEGTLDSNDEELGLQQTLDSKKITVRSRRQSERQVRREKAAEKAANSVVSVKSGSSSRKKRSSVQEVDYSDPLRYLRGMMTTSKLLTAGEESELSEGIQDLIKLENFQEELADRYGSPPTFSQWATAAGVDPKALRKRLDYGRCCKDKMIKSNIRLVISIAKNFQGAGMNLQDLVQEGCRGLVKGAEKFDASKGFKFSTYAHWWIKQAVRKSLSDQSRTIRLPFHMVEASYRVREARKQLYSENGRYPDDEEVAEATGLTVKRVIAVNQTPKAPRSLEQKIGINQSLKPLEVIADPNALTTEEILVKQLMKQNLGKVLDGLNPREKQVVRWRFGLEDGRMKTLQEIGELMGVSRERVRQIESCAFRKLKNKKRTKNLQQYLFS